MVISGIRCLLSTWDAEVNRHGQRRTVAACRLQALQNYMIDGLPFGSTI